MNPVLMMGAPPADGSGGGASGLLPMVIMWVLVLFIFYFLMIRPQRAKQKQMEQMLNSLAKGDRVLTSGGLLGSVVGVKDNVVVLKIAEQVKVEVAKSAVTQVLDREGAAKE